MELIQNPGKNMPTLSQTSASLVNTVTSNPAVQFITVQLECPSGWHCARVASQNTDNISAKIQLTKYFQGETLLGRRYWVWYVGSTILSLRRWSWSDLLTPRWDIGKYYFPLLSSSRSVRLQARVIQILISALLGVNVWEISNLK